MNVEGEGDIPMAYMYMYAAPPPPPASCVTVTVSAATTCIASYPGLQLRGGKAWYTLFVHAFNFPKNHGK